MNQQPNVLFLFTDQQRADTIYAPGKPRRLVTPALDALAQGVCVIEAGHFETENPACEVMANALQNACDALKYNVTVFCSKGNPFGR